MRHTKKVYYGTVLALTALVACDASAGGLAAPIVETPVYVDSGKPVWTWSGIQVGGGITMTYRNTTTGTGEYEHECSSTAPGTHEGNKCIVSSETFDALLADGYTKVTNPWNHPDYKAGGDPGTPVLYTYQGYQALWLSNNESVSFTSPDAADGPTYPVKDALDYVLGEITDTSSEDAAGGVAFARGLFDMGRVVVGAEAGYYDGSGYADALVGYDMGRALPYVGYGTEGASVGVDYAVTRNIIVGAKAAQVDNDAWRPEVRVSFKF